MTERSDWLNDVSIKHILCVGWMVRPWPNARPPAGILPLS